MPRLARLMFAAALFAAALAARPRPALACTPPPGGLPHFTITDHVNASAIVVEGVVSAVREVNYLQAAEIQVAQYIKGNGPATITVDGYGPSGICLSEVFAGQYGLFYIVSDPGGYHAFYLSQFDAIGPVDPQSLAEAVAAAGQQPVPVASADAILFHLTEIARLTTTPTPTPPLPNDIALTQANATVFAAATEYASNPATQSAFMTEAVATIEAAAGLASGPSCTPAQFTTAEHAAAADVVLEGVVSSAVDNSAVIQVVQYLKLNSNAQVNAQINFDTASPCYVPPQVGDHFIYFAIGEPALVMYALDSNGYFPTVPADSFTTDIITAASGQPPIVMQDLASIQAMISLTGTAAPFVPTLLPYPTLPAAYPAPFVTPPTASPTALEAVGLIGVGVAIGVLLGGLGGVALGVWIGRWRE